MKMFKLNYQLGCIKFEIVVRKMNLIALLSCTDKKYLNKYCYLIFMKGVFLRHLNQKPEAIQCFEEVIKQ